MKLYSQVLIHQTRIMYQLQRANRFQIGSVVFKVGHWAARGVDIEKSDRTGWKRFGVDASDALQRRLTGLFDALTHKFAQLQQTTNGILEMK